MVPISASQRRLKTALDIIYAGTKFQKFETLAGRERCKMRAHSEADFEKLRAAQSVIPTLKANPPVRSESRQDGPTCKNLLSLG